jgi:hypothetical protein
MSTPKNLTCNETLRQVFICLRHPPLLGVCLGWGSNFVGSESGQRQSVKLMQNMVSKQDLTPQHPLPAKHCLHILYFDTEKGGGDLNQREGFEGQQLTMLGRKYPHDSLYLQYTNSDKHLPQNPFTGKFC